MLHSLQDMTDVGVIATDGEIGKIKNFLFDDQSWSVRYLVVQVGDWLARREVVVPVTVIDRPDWDHKMIHVCLSKEQVRHSPDVDTTKPVTRQQELAMKEYYGWPTFSECPFEAAFPPVPAGREYPLHTQEDPHLRSAVDVSGYEVRDQSREIGRLEHFIVDEHSWHIGYLDVKAGDWLHCRSMLISTHSVDSISWADRRVNLRHA